MRISPIFSQPIQTNSTAFQKTSNKKQSDNTGFRAGYDRNDIFVKMAEASYENSLRGAKMQLELQQMGLI